MSDGNRRDWIRAGIVGGALLLITIVIDTGGIPYVSEAVCREPDGRSLWCYAYAWQTLIAGFFALAGAGVTVWQIRKQIAVQMELENKRFIVQTICELKWCGVVNRALKILGTPMKKNQEILAQDPPIFNSLETVFFPTINFPEDIDPDVHTWISLLTGSITHHNQMVTTVQEAPNQDDIKETRKNIDTVIEGIEDLKSRIDEELMQPRFEVLLKAGWTPKKIDELMRYETSQTPDEDSHDAPSPALSG